MKNKKVKNLISLINKIKNKFTEDVVVPKEINISKEVIISDAKKVTAQVIKYLYSGDFSGVDKEISRIAEGFFEKGASQYDMFLLAGGYENYIKKAVKEYIKGEQNYKNIHEKIDEIFNKIKLSIAKFWEKKYKLLNKKLEKQIGVVRKERKESKFQVNKTEKSREAMLNILEDLKENISKLEKLDQMKSEFIDVISHQLRTPLSSIRWNLELLMGGDLGKIASDKQKTSISLSLQSIFILIDILEDTITAMNIERGTKFLLKKIPISLLEVVNSIINEKKELIEKNNINVKLKMNDRKMDNVYADYNIIKRVLEILINNAIQYSRKGGKIEISLKEVNRSKKKYARLTIADSGIGIPKDQQDRIFEKFFRAKNTPTHAPNGLGLGLYLVDNYTKIHDGFITFKSDDKGTAFYLDLPINNKQKNEKRKNFDY